MRTYTAHVYREGKWWMIAVPEIDGLTQARRLADAEAQARSLVSVDQDVAPSEVSIDIVVDSAGTVTEIGDRQARLFSARQREEAAREEASRLATDLATDLAHEGIPMRDIGQLLGVSFQRAGQLATFRHEASAKTPKR